MKNNIIYFFVMTLAVTIGSVASANPYFSGDESQTPGAIAEKKGEKISDDLRRTASDKERWQSFSLGSGDTDPKALELVLIKSSGFVMRLDPKEERLYFERKGLRQAFAIQGPSGGDEVCPKYSIRVIDAAVDHAVILQNCYADGAAPGTMEISSDYYLYDVKTAIMLDFWRSGTETKKIPLAFVRPDPVVKKTDNGYRIDWVYRDKTSAPQDAVTMHNVYHYAVDSDSKLLYLRCKDLTNTQGAEGDFCEKGGDLKAIIDNRMSTH
ncbi:hypothetical protein VOM14_17010 [Paraburkholderia sp. MPAMCS5]|uniref:hypothetical protein n=1 Tax=Paraburkholderia sp. MPAMCS5 TaxID=3112563 RepID=UPI002E16D399|nr:hypothetical protein [Paraburkholderia sp. MPAMCS5]